MVDQKRKQSPSKKDSSAIFITCFISFCIILFGGVEKKTFAPPNSMPSGPSRPSDRPWVVQQQQKIERYISSIQKAKQLPPTLPPSISKKSEPNVEKHRVHHVALKTRIGLNSKEPRRLIQMQETKLMSILFEFTVLSGQTNSKVVLFQVVDSRFGSGMSSHLIENKRQFRVLLKYVRFQKGTTFQLRFLDDTQNSDEKLEMITNIYTLDLSHLDTHYNEAKQKLKNQ